MHLYKILNNHRNYKKNESQKTNYTCNTKFTSSYLENKKAPIPVSSHDSWQLGSSSDIFWVIWAAHSDFIHHNYDILVPANRKPDHTTRVTIWGQKCKERVKGKKVKCKRQQRIMLYSFPHLTHKCFTKYVAWIQHTNMSTTQHIDTTNSKKYVHNKIKVLCLIRTCHACPTQVQHNMAPHLSVHAT